LLSLISHHGYLILAVVCLAEASVSHARRARRPDRRRGHCLWRSTSVPRDRRRGLAMIAGDVLLYFMGRVSGWALLGFLCRLSANPETCILRSQNIFTAGQADAAFCQFIPGINTMSPPLAGSMKMGLGDFLAIRCPRRDFYVGAYAIADISSVTRSAPSPADSAPPALPLKLSSASDSPPTPAIESGFTQVPSPRRDSSHPGGGTRPTTSVRRGSENAHRRCSQPRLLRCRLRTHCRIDSHRAQQPR